MSNSEKIEQIRFRADVADAEGMIEMEQFLAEYADLLDAIDKAEPVAELVNEYSEGHGYLCRHIKLLDLSLQDGTKFYAHPPKQEQSPKVAPTVAIDERAEFEKWYEADALPCEYGMFRRDRHDNNEYDSVEEQKAWRCWQAARKVSAPQVLQPASAPDEKLLLEAIARGWCHEANSHKEVDASLVVAIAMEVKAILKGEK